MAEYVAAEVLSYLYVAGVEWGTATAVAYVAEAAVYAAAIGYSQNQQSIARRRAREAFNSSQVDRLINVNSTETPRDLVLGRVRKGGQIFFRGSTGEDNVKFVVCVALAGHEIDALEGFYLNDTPVTLDGSGYVTDAPYSITTSVADAVPFAAGATSVTLPHVPTSYTIALYGSEGPAGTITGTLTGSTITFAPSIIGGDIVYHYDVVQPHVKLRYYLGAAGQTADATLISLFPDLWTADHVAIGTPYIIGEFNFNEDAFPSGLPQITAVLRGAKIYNPATTITEWTENPALMQRHVLLHPQFGKRTSLSLEEDARISQAASECATSTTWTVNGSTLTAPLYRASLVTQYGTAARDILDDLATAMAGRWSHAQGQFFTRAGVFHASVKTIVETDLATVTRGQGGQETSSSVTISTHKERASKFNTAQIRIWDASQHYKEVPLTPLKPAALVARDGTVIAQEFRMAAVPYSYQALHVAGITMRDSRDPLTVTLVCKLTVYHIELFDTVALTLARFGWSGKLFEVVGRKWFGQGTVQLILKETAAANYELDANFLPGGYAENTALTTPFLISPPTALTAASGTAELERLGDGTILSRVRVSWDAIINQAVLQGGWIDISYRMGGMGSWVQQTVSGDSLNALLRGLQDGAAMAIRARCRSAIATSKWSSQLTHTVVGKTELPTTPTSFTGSVSKGIIQWAWAPIADSDYNNTEVRSANSDWGLASPAPKFKGAANNCSEPAITIGTITRYVAHYDASGNRSSVVSASVVVTADDVSGVGFYALPITVYKQAATVPEAPSGGDYTFTGDIFTSPAGYTRELPTGSTIPTWASVWLFETTTPTVAVPGPIAVSDTYYTQGAGDAHWGNVVLSLHFTGANASTTFTDSSNNALTGTRTAPAQILTAGALIGSSSGSMGSNGHVAFASSSFSFGTGNATIEFAINTSSTGTVRGVIGSNTTDAWGIIVEADNGIRFAGQTGNLRSNTLTVGVTYHYALVRSAGVWTCYLNGVLQTRDSPLTDSYNYASAAAIEIGQFGLFTSLSVEGLLDEVRVTKGVARYTADFSAPTVAHPDASAPHTVLLMHGQALVDDSSTTKTVTAVGDAAVSTAQQQFGTSSYAFDSVTDCINVTQHTDFDFGLGDFTIEFWVRPTNFTSFPYVLTNRDGTHQGWYIALGDGSTVGWGRNGPVNSYHSLGGISSGIWTHLAVCRVSGVTKMYKNGVALGSPITDTANYSGVTQPLVLGADYYGAGNRLNGYMDEIRITRGVARYTGTFSVATEEFPGAPVGGWPTPIKMVESGNNGTNGTNGTNGDALFLLATAQTFTFDAAGAALPSSQTITLTATPAGSLSGTATVTCNLYNSAGTQSGIASPTPTLGGGGTNIRTLTNAQFDNAAFAVIVATLGAYTDQVTVVKLRDGATGVAAISGLLTNESTTVAADSAGTVASFTGSGGTFMVFDGVTDKTEDSGSVAYSVYGTPTGGLSISIASTGIYTVSGLTTDHGTAVLQAVVYGTVTISKFFDITKSKEGVSAIVLDLTTNAVALAADTTGYVSSYAAATTTAKVMLGSTDDTANWSFAITPSTGVTSSLSGAQVFVSAMTTDSGYVSIVATRSGYPTQTKRFTLTKARSAGSTSGVVDGLAFDSSSSTYTTATDTGVKFLGNGTVEIKSGGAYTTAGNWYAPTTAGIGTTPGYWIKVTKTGGNVPGGDSLATALALTANREWTYSVSGSGQRKYGSFTYIIYSDAGTTQVAAGTFDMTSETAPFV